MPPPLEGLSPEAEKEAHRALYDAQVAKHLATAGGSAGGGAAGGGSAGGGSAGGGSAGGS